jgi:hypothetical protein
VLHCPQRAGLTQYPRVQCPPTATGRRVQTAFYMPGTLFYRIYLRTVADMMMLPWIIIIVFTVSLLSPTVLHAFNPNPPLGFARQR